jgi:hypothetical protein
LVRVETLVVALDGAAFLTAVGVTAAGLLVEAVVAAVFLAGAAVGADWAITLSGDRATTAAATHIAPSTPAARFPLRSNTLAPRIS